MQSVQNDDGAVIILQRWMTWTVMHRVRQKK